MSPPTMPTLRPCNYIIWVVVMEDRDVPPDPSSKMDLLPSLQLSAAPGAASAAESNLSQDDALPGAACIG